ncbi:MAG: phosphatase PAP2-related protein, partial [Pirellulales bacterium]
NKWLQDNPRYANGVLIVSSAGVDFLALFLLGSSIFGRSMRPFLALLILFVLRQVCQGLTSLPPPDGMIWRYPGFPSLLVTYGVSNDLFFSGHTGISVVGAIELSRAGGKPYKLLGICIGLFEVATVLVLRAHYFMDVYAGAVTAILAVAAADWLTASRLNNGSVQPTESNA